MKFSLTSLVNTVSNERTYQVALRHHTSPVGAFEKPQLTGSKFSSETVQELPTGFVSPTTTDSKCQPTLSVCSIKKFRKRVNRPWIFNKLFTTDNGNSRKDIIDMTLNTTFGIPSKGN